MIERRLDLAEDAWRLLSTRRPERTTERGCRCARGREAFEIAVFDDECAPYRRERAVGAAEVVFYTDEHDATLARLGRERIEALVHVWADRYAELGSRPESFLAFVPFAPRFPYEVHVLSRRHAASLLDVTDPERASLMSVQQSLTDDGANAPISHFQIEFAPVHRSVTTLKHIAGSELGISEFVVDALPEVTAAELRAALAA